jgi:tetratricopeptide (TPR) repeat protein
VIDRTLHSANLLVAMAGLVSAPGIADAIGAAVSGALSARDLAKSLPAEARPLVEEIHTLLTRALTNAHLSESARTLIPQMLELSVPDADTIIKAGKDPARILTAMEATLDQKGDPAHAPPALRQCFRDTLTPALQRLMQDGAIADALQASFQTRALALLRAQNTRLETLIAQTGDKARELHLTEQLFIGLARRVSAKIDNIDDAHRELEAAVDRAAEMDRQAKLPSNLGAQVDAVLAEVARRNAVDDLDGAADVIADALAEADAHKSRLLTLAIDQSLLQLDPETAASHLIARADLEAGGRAGFEDLGPLQHEWYERGRVQGSRLDILVSVALGKQVVNRTTGADEHGIALNDLALALAELGGQSGDTGLLDQAVAAYGQALKERTCDRVPLHWAGTQNNLGNALKSLGDHRGDADLLEQAIAAYGQALKEYTRDRMPLHWAMSQNNLGNALQSLGELKGNAGLLDQAVAAYGEALKERARDRVPLDWAMTQNNLGIALKSLGDRWGDADLLDQAIAAYGQALKERTRDRVPLDWAMTQNNLGNALGALGQHRGDTDLLDQAVSAFGQALKERNRDRVPLDWAGTHGNLARVETARFDLTQDPSHLDVAQEYLDAARQVFEAHGADGYLQAVANVQAMIDARRG